MVNSNLFNVIFKIGIFNDNRVSRNPVELKVQSCHSNFARITKELRRHPPQTIGNQKPIQSNHGCLVKTQPISSLCSLNKKRVRKQPTWSMDRLYSFLTRLMSLRLHSLLCLINIAVSRFLATKQFEMNFPLGFAFPAY